MMIVVANLRLSGFFTLVSAWVVEHAHRPMVLLCGIVLVSGVLLGVLCERHHVPGAHAAGARNHTRLRRNPVPYLLAVAMAANIGSVATITGNPQNMMIGSFSGIGYRDFAAALAPIAAAGLLVLIALLSRSSTAASSARRRRLAVEHRPVQVDRRAALEIAAGIGRHDRFLLCRMAGGRSGAGRGRAAADHPPRKTGDASTARSIGPCW